MADAGYALGYMNNTIYFSIYSVVLRYLVKAPSASIHCGAYDCVQIKFNRL
jgi:hypothetical protein